MPYQHDVLVLITEYASSMQYRSTSHLSKHSLDKSQTSGSSSPSPSGNLFITRKIPMNLTPSFLLNPMRKEAIGLILLKTRETSDDTQKIITRWDGTPCKFSLSSCDLVVFVELLSQFHVPRQFRHE